jgi:hypothetical protein
MIGFKVSLDMLYSLINFVCKYLMGLYALRNALYLYRRRTKKTPRHVSVFILQMGLEPTIPMFEL